MSDITKKLEVLEELVQQETRSLSVNMKITAVVYAVLVIFVFSYTTYIVGQFREKATPDSLAVMATDMAEKQIPEMRKYLGKHIKERAPQWAGQIVGYVHQLIPQLENTAKEQINTLIEKIVGDLKTDHIPNLRAHVQERLNHVFKDSDVVNDKHTAQAVAEVLIEETDKELSKLINERFSWSVKDLSDKVDQLTHQPNSKLTQRDLAKKRVLVYWMFMLNHGEVGDSKIASLVRSLSFMMQAVTDQHISHEKEDISL